MAIGGAFLGGGVEVVPAGSCKLELEILTEDRTNLTATFTIKGTSTYTVTAGVDGRAVYTVPSGQTYTVSVNTTGYDNIASQTVVAESGTVRYVRFEAFAGRVKRSGDTMTGNLMIQSTTNKQFRIKRTDMDRTAEQVFPSSGTTIDGGFFLLDNGDRTLVSVNRATSSNGIVTTLQNSQTVNGAIRHCNLVLTISKNGDMYASVPSPSDNSDNSTKIATTEWVTRATSVVHKSGDEEIQGYKKFSKSPMTTAWTGYHITLPGMTKGEKVLELNTNLYTGFFDKNDKGTNQPANMMAGLRFTVPPGTESAPPNTFIELSNQYYRDTYLRLYDNGTTAYATCPNPPSDANTNQITTARWTLGKFVKKSGDTMSDNLIVAKGGVSSLILKRTDVNKDQPTYKQLGVIRADASNGMSSQIEFLRNTPLGYLASGVIISAYNSTGTQQSISLYSFDEGVKQDAYVQHPSWSVGTNDNSDKSLTIKMANSLPSLVHTTGNESIAGVKTFTGITYLNTSYGNLRLNMKNLSQTSTPPSSKQVNYIAVKTVGVDGNESTVWQLETAQETSGLKYIQLATNFVNSNDTNARNWRYPFRAMQREDGNLTVRTISPPSDANSDEIATAGWVNTKVAQRNKVTNVTSYTQLIELIKNGKRGDSFGITMDYVGGSLGGITATNREVHAFGHYTIDEITVSDGALTGLQAFGSGEVSGMLKDNDNTTYTYATTGFGRQKIGNGVIDALRVVEDGKLTYFAPNDDSTSISSFEGYYISI